MRRALVLLLVAGCTDGASSDPGYAALIYIDDAQFRPGAFPAATGGPPMPDVQTTEQTILLGGNRESLRVVLDPAAKAVIAGIPGARGAWIAPAGAPDFDTPDQPNVHATFGLDDALGPGPFELDVAAVDAQGRIGEPTAVPLIAAEDPPPDGDLVIGLEWTGAADLDLHVVDPTGAEAWVGHPNTYQLPPPGTPTDPCGWAAGGILDHDGNAACTRDGKPNEHVIWKTRACAGQMIAPAIAPGTYTVRVDARSLCGDANAPWAVSIYRAGTLVAAARGIATPYDVAYEPHGNGAGTTALQTPLQ